MDKMLPETEEHSPTRSRKCHPPRQYPAAAEHHSGPTTFFLRKCSPEGVHDSHEGAEEGDMAHSAEMTDSTYGVQSLEDALDSAFLDDIDSPTSQGGAERHPSTNTHDASASHLVSALPGEITSEKRKRGGNRIHPRIAAAAQRIISNSDRNPKHRPSTPNSALAHVPHLSPDPRLHARSTSDASLQSSFTPLRYSPMPESALPSTPRSGSFKSLRLSDEEGSLVGDDVSQAVQTDDEDEDDMPQEQIEHVRPAPSDIAVSDSAPQLIMPSIMMPSRRPFTDRGKRMGRLRVLVAGPAGIGKSSLIRNLMHTCNDIVHVDPPCAVSSTIGSQPAHITYPSTRQIVELNASTKVQPSWWCDAEKRRRRSLVEQVLDRNICFVDTPGWERSGPNADENMQISQDSTIQYLETLMDRNISPNELSDSDLLTVLSGGGGFQVDAVLYCVQSTTYEMPPEELAFLRRLSKITNIVPVLSQADLCPEEHIRDAKAAMRSSLLAAGVKFFSFQDPQAARQQDFHGSSSCVPFAVSCATTDDAEVMDTSLIMSPDYHPNLIPSELPELARQLFEPDNMQWLRHSAVGKFLSWRREEQIKASLQTHKRDLYMLHGTHAGLAVEAGADARLALSLQQMASGILVPRPDSSYYRPTSRASSNLSFASRDVLDEFGNFQSPDSRRGDLHVADWAHDLQRAMNAERFRHPPWDVSGDVLSDTGRDQNHVLIEWQRNSGYHQRPSSQKQGAKTPTMLDTRDPLGMLAFGDVVSKRGRQVLRILGGYGVVATVALWMLRNWSTVAEILGISTPEMHIPCGYALVGPAASGTEGAGVLDGWNWKEMFWSDKWH